jgi:hypothetical protein
VTSGCLLDLEAERECYWVEKPLIERALKKHWHFFETIQPLSWHSWLDGDLKVEVRMITGSGSVWVLAELLIRQLSVSS